MESQALVFHGYGDIWNWAFPLQRLYKLPEIIIRNTDSYVGHGAFMLMALTLS